MQAYAEGFDILKNANIDALPEAHRFDIDIADVAEVWRRGSVIPSWLLDLTASALAENETLSEYSGFVGDNGHNEPDNGTFLRGGVLTNSSGVANITTVYPGWYVGRCVHIHLKVHTNVTLTSDGSFTGGQELHTGQLFFNETITAKVAALSTYAANTVTRTTLAQDSIYDEGGAASGLLTLTALGSSTSAGYAGTLTVGVESS
jgi:hypothetical protein